VRLGDGSYRMYYSGWSGDPIEARIFSATSKDGLQWKKDQRPCLDIGGKWDGVKLSEPCVIQIPDGEIPDVLRGDQRFGISHPERHVGWGRPRIDFSV